MQFRPQGNRIQVLAYRGYDKEKKRAQVKLVGSFDAYNYSPSDGLIDSLTDDEKEELQAHIKALRKKKKDETVKSDLDHLYRRIADLSASLFTREYAPQVTPKQALALYGAMNSLADSLKRAGHRRPARRAPKLVALTK